MMDTAWAAAVIVAAGIVGYGFRDLKGPVQGQQSTSQSSQLHEDYRKMTTPPADYNPVAGLGELLPRSTGTPPLNSSTERKG